ncbi:unnamed protein product [Taenia asiatica]|uniref:ubiquitinyl hydrolase 1 n=1 Tax=Taenia asiatica TaxID=60517 RepID=A0A0R3VW39_TAEAS|nr:unnamed protein product [Taenia asiatica]
MTDPPSTEAYLPKMLKESFDRSHSMFADGQQQDSHEFLMILLDSLHEELNRSEMKCIEKFFESEALSGENLWLCPQCKIPCEAVKTFGIWRLPEYLIIHLKRFRSYITCEKIDSYVYFPLAGLNLSDFTKNIAVSDCIYDLYGVINHHGSVQSGHYTAFCFDSADHQWRNFDDSRVTELSEAEIRTRAAYVLFYKRSRVSPKTA